MNRVTIAGLADQLRLSKASVSYALNGQPGVSDETRRRVLELADELGWHPSSSARALSRSRTDAIGIVLRRDPSLLGTEPFYMSLLAGVESVLAETDQALLLRMVGTNPGQDLDTYRRWSAEGRVDGVLLFDIAVDDPRPALLDKLGLAFVLHGARPQIAPGRVLVYDVRGDAGLIVGPPGGARPSRPAARHRTARLRARARPPRLGRGVRAGPRDAPGVRRIRLQHGGG